MKRDIMIKSICQAPFSLMVRRHHCRACGQVVCGQCSASKAPIKYKNFETVRVCPKCCETLRQSMTQSICVDVDNIHV